MNPLYEDDFYAWIEQQANYLRNEQYESLDYTHILEEMDQLGRSEKRTLRSYLKNALTHMLKIKYQPLWRTKSWDNSVDFSVAEANEMLKESRSLRNELPGIFNRAYKLARYEASKQTGIDLDIFEKECPWTIDEILGRE